MSQFVVLLTLSNHHSQACNRVGRQRKPMFYLVQRIPYRHILSYPLLVTISRKDEFDIKERR